MFMGIADGGRISAVRRAGASRTRRSAAALARRRDRRHRPRRRDLRRTGPRAPRPRARLWHRQGRPPSPRPRARPARCRARPARDARHPLPHRVDVKGVHRHGEPEAARRRQAVARRSRRDLCPPLEGLALPDQRQPQDHRARPAPPQRRLRRGQSLGRPSAAAVGGRLLGHAGRGRRIRQRARHSNGVFQFRLCAARPHRRQRIGRALSGLYRTPAARPARDAQFRL